MKKTYVIAAAVATAMMPMFALTAFAQTNVGTNGSWHSMGRGHGKGGVHVGTMPTRAHGVFGTVTAISGSTLTVTSKAFGPNATATTYTVNAASATVKKNGAAATLADVAVGDTVMVQGTTSGTTVTATAINDGVGRGTMKPGITGTVTAISGSTLTVTIKDSDEGSTATAYTVDASSATFDKNGTATTLSGIAVGDTVRVDGTTNGTSMTATAVHDGAGRGGMMKPQDGDAQQPPVVGNGQPVIMGNVTAVSGSSLTITNNGNVSYSIDASSAKVTKSGKAATTADVGVGDRIVVQGTVNGTSIVASSVIDQGAPRTAPSNTTGSTNAPKHAPRTGFFGHIQDFFSHLFGF